MGSWKQTIVEGMSPGALASVAWSGVLVLRAKKETGSAFAGSNATSHCLWGGEAFEHDAAS